MEDLYLKSALMYEKEQINRTKMMADLMALDPGDLAALHDVMRILATAAADRERIEKEACAELWNLCNKEDDSENSRDAFESLNIGRTQRRYYTTLRRRYERLTAFAKKFSKHRHRMNASNSR